MEKLLAKPAELCTIFVEIFNGEHQGGVGSSLLSMNGNTDQPEDVQELQTIMQ